MNAVPSDQWESGKVGKSPVSLRSHFPTFPLSHFAIRVHPRSSAVSNPQSTIRNPQSHGFTLIELLVVVAILALLAAMLLPCLSAAREQTKAVMCRNNLRAIWTGVLTYALDHRDRVPFIEDPNDGDPAADPFSRDFPTAVGNVLRRYVIDGSWTCPSAVDGFPRSPGPWKLTYRFSTAGPVGKGVPYDDDPAKDTGSLLDPAISNYVHFDGRPIRLLDGRRYVPKGSGKNVNAKGYWNVRFPLISDRYRPPPDGSTDPAAYEYPHRAQLSGRGDLGRARDDFERLIGARAGRRTTGYQELHADAEKVEMFFTRRNPAFSPPGT